MKFNKGILVNLYHKYKLILNFLICMKMAKLTTIVNQTYYIIFLANLIFRLQKKLLRLYHTNELLSFYQLRILYLALLKRPMPQWFIYPPLGSHTFEGATSSRKGRTPTLPWTKKKKKDSLPNFKPDTFQSFLTINVIGT